MVRRRPSAASSSSSSSLSAAGKKKKKVSRFRHISYRTTKTQEGWIVQYGGRTHGGFHLNESDAWRTLRSAIKSATGRFVKTLPLKRSRAVPKQPTTSSKDAKYGISFHKGIGRWVGNQVSLGQTYATSEEAHQALLRLRPAAKTSTPLKRQAVSVSDLMDRTQKLVRWGEKGNWLPPDLIATRDHAVKSQTMFEFEPSLEPLSLHLKYGPWKDALLKSFQDTAEAKSGLAVKSKSKSCRARFLKKVALSAAKVISRRPVSPEWPKNANRFRHREQGPAVCLQNLGLVSASARRRKYRNQGSPCFCWHA